MANSATSSNKSKSVGDPHSRYESLKHLWRRSRGVLNGQAHVKELDAYVDTVGFSNILLPFSPSMTNEQYNFYKAEAELPGLTAQYVKVLVGGMLRKQPHIKLPDSAPEDALEWIRNTFTSNDNSMMSFLDEALNEEFQTSRAWVMVDYPVVNNPENLSKAERDSITPYPILVNAESVVNWKMGSHPKTGVNCLTMLVIRTFETSYAENEFHPNYEEVAYVHKLNADGQYVVDKYKYNRGEAVNVEYINGVKQQDYSVTATGGNKSGKSAWSFVTTFDNILSNDKHLEFIPAVPLNGNIEGEEPMLMPLIDREVSLYNKVSRRNHLLLGSATYTPVVASDMTDDQFDNLVSAGLGSWIKVAQGDEVSALETPSKALRDMEAIIQNTINEMARLGIRMMAAESGGGRDSGVALEIRNAGQTALLASIGKKASQQIRKVIVWMLNWRYDTDYKIEEIEFDLSPDLNPAPIGADWLRLVTEWYQGGIIPRSVFLDLAKSNDLIDSEYNDDIGRSEIDEDDLIMGGLDPQDMEGIINKQVNAPVTLQEKEEDDD